MKKILIRIKKAWFPKKKETSPKDIEAITKEIGERFGSVLVKLSER